MNDDELLKKLEEEILPPKAQMLKESAELLNNSSLYVFGKAVEILIKAALAQYYEAAGVTKAEELSQGARYRFFVVTLLALNEVLPVDHRYILMVVRIRDVGVMQFLSVARTKIEGYREIATARIAPIGEVATRADLYDPGLKLKPQWPDRGDLPADPTL